MVNATFYADLKMSDIVLFEISEDTIIVNYLRITIVVLLSRS